MNAVSQDFGPCPCGWALCETEVGPGTKLTKYGHLVGCKCPPCRGRRNQRKGKRGEYNRHKNLGGTGPTPHDELPHTYPLVVTTQDKVGGQVPQSFVDFVNSVFYRKAMNQAIKKLAIGSDAHPALYLEPDGGGAWLLVDIAPKTKRKLEPRG